MFIYKQLTLVHVGNVYQFEYSVGNHQERFWTLQVKSPTIHRQKCKENGQWDNPFKTQFTKNANYFIFYIHVLHLRLLFLNTKEIV